MATTNGWGGYERWRATAIALKKQGPPPKKTAPAYGNMATNELEHLKLTAEKWMTENMEHPNFPEANRRYMAIVDELEFRNVQETLIKP